jgi:hypothetical protein
MLNKLLLIAAVATAAVAAPPPPTDDVVRVIMPAPGEQAWLAIPWETDLTEARRRAITENRPIFLWEMDGHPLGCT